MKKSRLIFVTILTLLFSLYSCKEIKEKVDDSLKDKFVKNFNSVSEKFKANPRIADAYALKNDSTSEVNIVFKVAEVGEDDQYTVKLLTKMLPNIISVVVNEIRTSRNLIEDGHGFLAIIKDSKDSTVSTLRIDKNKLEELTNEIKNKTSEFVLCDVSDMISKVFVTLNSSLPVEDKETGLNLMKILLNEDKKMVYLFEVVPESEEIIDSPFLKEIFITTLKNEPSIQNLKSVFMKEGIQTIQYQFTNQKGDLLKEIDILFTEI